MSGILNHRFNLVAENLLRQAGTIVRSLRTPLLMLALKERSLNMPKIDCAVRWVSQFDMLSRLVELEDFVKEMSRSVPTEHP